MPYRELAPPEQLAADIACIWSDDRAHGQQVLPDGCIDIVWMQGSEPFVAGPMTQAFQASAWQLSIGMRFLSGRAPGFLGLPADAFLNTDVPLRELWGDAALRLWERLETHPEQAARILTNATLGQRQRESDALVGAAVQALRRDPLVRVSDLGDDLGVSERQLLRRFTAAVGYGPRVLGRILRFQQFIELVWTPSTAAWDLARFAAETGYADQAHLARECAALAGRTPSALRPTHPLTP